MTLLNRVVKLLPTDRAAQSAEIADVRQAMLQAIAQGDETILHSLIVKNESVNFTLNGTTPLHLAAEKGYTDIVRILIGHGADFRKKNAEGMTPLEVALAKMKFIHTEEILHNAHATYLTSSDR
jgi:ankyrin repeat protein